MTQAIKITAFAAALAAALAAPAFAQDEQAFVRSHDDEALEWGPCPDFLPEGCAIAGLHGDPAGPNADVFFKLPAGTTADRHWHGSAERMVLVSGELEVAYDGQDAATLRTGDYAYGPAQLPHSAQCVSDEDCVLFIAFIEPVDALPGAPD